MTRDEGYIDNHGIIIPIPSFSSKIINVAPIDGEKHITQRMENLIANPCIVESSDSEEEDDEVDKKEGDDDEEEDVDNEEDELATDKGEDSV